MQSPTELSIVLPITNLSLGITILRTETQSLSLALLMEKYTAPETDFVRSNNVPKSNPVMTMHESLSFCKTSLPGN